MIFIAALFTPSGRVSRMRGGAGAANTSAGLLTFGGSFCSEANAFIANRHWLRSLKPHGQLLHIARFASRLRPWNQIIALATKFPVDTPVVATKIAVRKS
jgi:hypothetical protein